MPPSEPNKKDKPTEKKTKKILKKNNAWWVKYDKYKKLKEEIELLQQQLVDQTQELNDSQNVILIRELRTKIQAKETHITEITRERDLQRNKADRLLAGDNELNNTIQQLRKENANLQRRQDSGYGDNEEANEATKLIQENNRLSTQIRELEKRPTEAQADATAREIYEPALNQATAQIINLEAQIQQINRERERESNQQGVLAWKDRESKTIPILLSLTPKHKMITE